MVKKVGILTLPPIYNYGNILQIYALQYVINDMGYEAVLINRNPQRNRLSYIKNRISVFVADLLKLRKGYFYRIVFRSVEQPKITRNIQA